MSWTIVIVNFLAIAVAVGGIFVAFVAGQIYAGRRENVHAKNAAIVNLVKSLIIVSTAIIAVDLFYIFRIQ